MTQKASYDDKIAETPFGKRRIKPRACIVESKHHVRSLLSETLEEQGFIPHACATLDDLDASLRSDFPDLVVISFSMNGLPVPDILNLLAVRACAATVLLIGPPDAPAVRAARELGEKLALDLLPMLPTPFSDRDLHARVAALVPAEPPPPPVDVAEALGAGWLELWYQPKIDARSLALGGAEALIRLRHPNWGIVPPAYFLPDEDDPNFRALSHFVIGRVFQDWRYLVAKSGSIHISINLPLAFFADANAVDDLRLQFPDHPAFDGLTVEVDGSAVVRNLPLAVEAAQRLRYHNIGFSIDDVGTEWPALAALDEFPFAEIKLDRKFVDGSSSARLKRSVCSQIVDLAKSHGVKTVAEGVETRDDFLAMHGIGVDFIQGFLFGKPMTTRKFARNSRQRPAFVPVA
ncbi:response regulator receiver (CheY-like) modulated diguanylate phosphodiesterase (EAL domain) [Nitrobacter hamburgensis X14]|uniref:Response regulator receiver (CheY-like) modulated diguanylate phosphodiesterase (EAL domain) n=1 Tax=Nitrobacter hamburgensis (strain DSM 10229 / NCIMB 13809 / X14) TaxID=323097 RepID=Q1QJ98_NITHX|nr:EAL domain-containing response regulator [Nitrobacter hamburgensis]ABE63699.1 response regulator receiver (CheY-like) modulated diguanylate phosphodiesterase (EAL domain) [Nitrobacter hamburgensis X14]